MYVSYVRIKDFIISLLVYFEIPLEFNLSHSKQKALIGIARSYFTFEYV